MKEKKSKKWILYLEKEGNDYPFFKLTNSKTTICFKDLTIKNKSNWKFPFELVGMDGISAINLTYGELVNIVSEYLYIQSMHVLENFNFNLDKTSFKFNLEIIKQQKEELEKSEPEKEIE